jgi:hypothetical protein
MKYLACTSFYPEGSPNAGECETQAWVEQPSWVDYAPTMEDAQSVGFQMFASIAIIAAMLLLLPRRYGDDE